MKTKRGDYILNNTDIYIYIYIYIYDFFVEMCI